MSIRKRDVIEEIETLTGFKWQAAKAIHDLADKPPGTVQKIGPSKRGAKAPMTQENAAKIVEAALTRIKLVDEGG